MKNYHNPEVNLVTDEGVTYLTIEHDKEENLAYMDWHWKYDYGFDYIKEGAERVLDFIIKYQLDGAIINLKKVEGTWDPINDWITTEWLPKLQETTAKFWVHIQPEDFFAELAAELMVEGFMMGKVRAANVKSMDEAFSWIERFGKIPA